MGFLGKILDKLGIGGEQPPKVVAQAPPRPVTPPRAVPQGGVAVEVAPPPVAVTPPPIQAISLVDVVAQLEQRAAANPQKLDWKASIVDLLKLLEIDSSSAARKELAVELGCPEELMADSAKMNVWLHKAVLSRIAANGGNVPPELLD
jgi:hypothetical protein